MKKTCFFLYICVKVWYRQNNCQHWKRAADTCTVYTLARYKPMLRLAIPASLWRSWKIDYSSWRSWKRQHLIKAHQIYCSWLLFSKLRKNVILWNSTDQFEFFSSQLYLNDKKVRNQENNCGSQNTNSWKGLSPYSSQGCRAFLNAEEPAHVACVVNQLMNKQCSQW